ncbi:hypothetical protein N7509_011495 [Penicillium cosmopolitanum]|uniref:FAD/NAD(P)-binding domain-containing protein n=1 Tax=Penicillium cosmopolitanum TaxID=1131564 RepID=A0A9W9SGW6_9EURO|nr:uncharacterized protein N7509_011495 [Penicillium cosmopolitanum]KAJ5378376.1 hypothetical protein N7509_011495 [Penicillium cosmopolitanum]
MGESIEDLTIPKDRVTLDADVLVIGAGLAGIYTAISMKRLGLRVKVIERAPEVGGVWYWNKYPGARFDSESYTYMFTFSKELLDEWNWKEHFSAQADTLKYINYIVDRFDIRSNFQLETEVKSARYNSATRSWTLTDSNKRTYTSKFLINCLGPLTTPTLPDIPDGHVSLTGKRVGVIGTGATGIQTIQEVAKTAKKLTVFQRTANWTAPLRNSNIDQAEMESIRERYPDIIRACKSSPMGFMYQPDPREALKLSREEREALWEGQYNQRGLVKWVGNFKDTFTSQEANDLYSEWMSKKIRARVSDPNVAKKLIPKSHGFGTRRVPLENGYYELFNEPHVKLVDLYDTPIERITETSVKTTTENFELDVLIYATGFDALTGSYEEIEYFGEEGLSLKKCWERGPRTYLGFAVPGFPNMFNILGPHQATGNIPHVIEYAVEWVSTFIKYLQKHDLTYVNPNAEGEEKWTQHVYDCTKTPLSAKVNSWMTGYNSNRPGKSQRRVIRYFGNNIEFRRRCEEVAANGYENFDMK